MSDNRIGERLKNGILIENPTFVLMLGFILLKMGYSGDKFPALIHSLISAFFTAGLTEETAKFFMILLSVRIFRSRISNVYEYILIGSAVGFGFTLFEEFIYSSGSIAALTGRIITLAGHMIFGMIMAEHLGLARYNKKTGRGPVIREYVLAVVIPVLIHTLYDACTADNKFMNSRDERSVLIGVIISIASIIALFVLQIVVLSRFKKNGKKYCDMEFISNGSGYTD